MDRLEPLDQAVVVVTGASGGVGRAAAVEFARRGAYVAVLARGRVGLEAAARDVRAEGTRALPIEVDVADARAVEAAAQQVIDEWGRIDVWVNVAFASIFAELVDIEPDEFRRATEVTYLGYVYGAMAALRRMRPANRGTIVNVGSALSHRGIPLQSAYCGAKHAIQGFTESLRCELLHEKSAVTATMVQLPATNTPQFEWALSRLPRKAQPVPPIYQPEVAAQTIVWAASHRRRSYWVGASTVATIIGNRVAPGLLDHYLARTGYDAQQTKQGRLSDQPANLWQPADSDEDYRAHGPFDARAHAVGVQPWLSRHRRGVAGAAVAVAALFAARRAR